MMMMNDDDDDDDDDGGGGRNYNDALPLKATRSDDISSLASSGASNLSCRQTQCRLEPRWGATLTPLRGCAMDWRWNAILRVGKNSGPF